MQTAFYSHIFSILCLWCLTSLPGATQHFYDEADRFFQTFVMDGLVDYTAIQKEPILLGQLIDHIAKHEADDGSKAFAINAYNLVSIHKVLAAYPVASPKSIPGFFNQATHQFGGESMSLDNFEKRILAHFQDVRLHFGLVCAARSCPPLLSRAYRPELVEQQLDEQASKLINDPEQLQLVRADKLSLPEWMNWYRKEFQVAGGLLAFINHYRQQPYPANTKLEFHSYNWQLNDRLATLSATNQQAYRASVLLQPGQREIKVFNSVYTQKDFDGFEQLNSRDTYFSSFIQYLYGQNEQLNIGFDVVLKSNLLNDFSDALPFRALGLRTFREIQSFRCDAPGRNLAEGSFCGSPGHSGRDSLRDWEGGLLETTGAAGIAHIGPKVKFNPLRSRGNLSLQQTLYFPVQDDLDGRFISFSQLFYDRLIGNRFQLFSELSLWTSLAPEFHIDSFFKLFFSYFPTNRWTVYATTTVPYEFGVGSKFFITPQLEVELLYTYLAPIERYVGFSRPRTFNLGIRYQR